MAILCEQRGIKYPELAELMGEAGCPIAVSALYRLHPDPKADPPRPARPMRVAELIAMANVFDITVEDLLRPPEVVEREWVEDVAKDIIEASRAFDAAQAQVVRAFVRLGSLASSSAELEEAVSNQWVTYGKTSTDALSRQWFADMEFADVDPALMSRCAELGVAFWESAAAIADSLVDD